jgi:hypothetical protein
MRTRSRAFDSVKTNSVVKWSLRALGVIFLGALGSGLWETALRPGLVRLSYGILSLSTLGLESIRSGIYERIASGSTSAASLQTMFLLTMFGVVAYLTVFQFMLYSVRNERRELARLEQRIAEMGKEKKTPPETKTAEQILASWRGEIRIGRRLLYILGVSILLASGMLVVDLSRINFETAAVVHFQQALKIASPYLTDTDRAMVESKFAQIHSKAEYVAIVGDLAQTAKAHGQTVPPFSAW